MTERELFKETFSQLHASEDTLTEVMNMAKHENITYMNKTKRRPARKLIAIVAVAALLVTGAVAAVSSNFFQDAFGDKGLTDYEPVEVPKGNGNSYTLPGMEWGSVDEETASALVGEAVTPIGETIDIGNYNVTVDSYVMDDNGVGVVTWTVANPNGVGHVDEAGRGIVYFGPASFMAEPDFRGGNGDFINSYCVRDDALTTDTELHLVSYIATISDVVSTDGVVLKLKIDGEGRDIVFPAADTVASVTFTGGEYTAHVSPMSIRFEAPFGEGAEIGWVPHDLTIHYADGTEYVCQQEDPYMENTVFGQYRSLDGNGLGDLVYVFNRLIDPAEVASVTIGGPNDTTLTFTPVQ